YFSRRHASWLPRSLNRTVDDIALMSSTGRPVGVLAEPRNDATLGSFTWSADSRSLAYTVTADNGPTRLVIRSIRSRHAKAFTLAVPLREIAWAPDGSSFVGVAATMNGPGVPPSGDDLWLVSARTGAERRLTHFATG